jgi:hypothetical protein
MGVQDIWSGLAEETEMLCQLNLNAGLADSYESLYAAGACVLQVKNTAPKVRPRQRQPLDLDSALAEARLTRYSKVQL